MRTPPPSPPPRFLLSTSPPTCHDKELKIGTTCQTTARTYIYSTGSTSQYTVNHRFHRFDAYMYIVFNVTPCAVIIYYVSTLHSERVLSNEPPLRPHTALRRTTGPLCGDSAIHVQAQPFRCNHVYDTLHARQTHYLVVHLPYAAHGMALIRLIGARVGRVPSSLYGMYICTNQERKLKVLFRYLGVSWVAGALQLTSSAGLLL